MKSLPTVGAPSVGRITPCNERSAAARTMNPVDLLENRLAQAWPPPRWSPVGVLLAVSGGADSVALLRAALARKAPGPGRLVVAHVHHGLRGAEADADEAFVRQLCDELDVACEVGRADVAQLAATEGDGVEAAARAARYAFLQETAGRLGARYVATAHTADDQAETILHRIVRGTGLAGLSGMETSRELCEGVALVRPLLFVRRVEVIDYLSALDQPFREDTSNRDESFTRNRLRRSLLPQLAADYNPGVVEALLRLGRLAGDAQRLIAAQAERLHTDAVREEGSATVVVDCPSLAGVDDYLVRELLMLIWRKRRWPQQVMGLAHWEQLAAMVDPGASETRKSFPHGVDARRTGEQLVLTRPT
ncbi:MAG: tRNA lysidine(34) synthetase TilS [Planctomycetota bacterium]|nr:MAG: tRNA lysidine(34) synthetase TilS [Planctomycetota bacterium]REK46758.1 MAG: tRNA lysidine(34) synthetase TilS [Planctomycetota bacterium]